MQIQLKPLLLISLFSLTLTSSLCSADTLQDIFDLALKNDPVIRAAEASLRDGLEDKNLGRSGLLPQVSLRGSYSENTRETNGGADEEAQSTTLSASIDQTLFDLPAWYNYKRGSALAEQAEQTYLSAKQDLIIRVTTAYLDVLRALDNMDATKSEEVAFASQLEQTQQRYEVGLIAITDVYEAQASYDNVVTRLLNDIGSVSIAFENLSVLTGREHNSIAPLSNDFPITIPMPESVDEWVDLALENNFDLKSASFSRDASKHNAASRKWEHLPSLSLGIDYSEISGGAAQGVQGISNDISQRSIVLNLNAPLYLGGSISASRRQASYQYQAAKENLNSTLISNSL